jgi:hypothetical protein
MKKYNTPSLEAYEAEVMDVITASGDPTQNTPHFVEGTNASTTTTGGVASWDSAWNVD